MTSKKEEYTSPMGVQQYTIIIYIRISFEVINTTTLSLTIGRYSLTKVMNTSGHVIIVESSS